MINDAITAPQLRLIGAEGEQLGVLSLEQAFVEAQRAGVDLVMMSPNAKPPVCKLLDYGKYKYERSKKANLARKNQQVIQLKEIKLRASTDQHDLDTKLKNVRKFLEAGNKVKLSLRFRGREMAYIGRGADMLKRVAEEVSDLAKVEKEPNMEGRQMLLILAPLKH
ncbi:MAG: translation initiation factor IF-3 [Mariprofundales bacterium]|nr:translation initiation factor IF-3 [Mariprofundales bacterium]